MNIGGRIKYLREKLDMSQKQLSEKAKINTSVMNRIESGERPVRDDELIIFSKIFDVSTDYILGLTDEKNPKKEINNATTIAAHRLGDIEQLPDDAIDEINNYIDLMRLKYLKDKR
ncbi:helix-turn-helix domain-containing protein [Terrisporobacter muris]|uniref:Helix-turn-helix domain-containing protein n=1 Tax=Terrisporobacter muris TaxID=2963284 RepID=A0A9X2MA40_9FIRM|nr:helix-turn-helix transcriptional regulator [Terrisporobacter muris]MCR1822639.1 helix-turn-helix domain-containing protein [Terrisporobacter muris]